MVEPARPRTNSETSLQNLLQLLLIGQPELRELSGRNDLRQLAQRVTARFHLQPLAREETTAYVRHRLRIAGSTSEIFSGAALREVHRLSGGVPRVINIICDRALRGAYTEEHHHISSALVRRAASAIFGLVRIVLGDPVLHANWMRVALLTAAAAMGAAILRTHWQPPTETDLGRPASLDYNCGGLDFSGLSR